MTTLENLYYGNIGLAEKYQDYVIEMSGLPRKDAFGLSIKLGIKIIVETFLTTPSISKRHKNKPMKLEISSNLIGGLIIFIFYTTQISSL